VRTSSFFRCWIILLVAGGATALVLALPLSARAAPRAENSARDPAEQAIDQALEFLQRTQERDGSWRAGRFRKNAAITGLAVLAFLAAGQVPGEGPYGENVTRGIRWVLEVQQPNGLLATEGSQEMYHHGICTLMLAEVAGMVDGSLAQEVRHKLERAVAVILRAQRTSGLHRGGWRYQVNQIDGDISVTGWQMLALRAAKNLGCDVPPESIELAVDYVQRCRDPASGGFRYHPRAGVTIPCTGTSILALEICGKDRHGTPEALRAGALLLRNPPRWGQNHFFYSVYYSAQAMFQLGDNYWSFYRPQLHEVLLRNQNENGSWLARDAESFQYGPNYCTAMGVLALAVEYRYLPIYQRGEEPVEKPGP
jgi:hypothetical protein